MTGNVPYAPSSFVGRAGELAHVRRLLQIHRLGTLSGVGGTGKSRLAAQVLHRMRAGGLAMWWVDLGAVTDSDHVDHACARAVGARVDQAGDPLRAITAQLRDTEAVVCLDTCEHVLDAAAKVAAHVLETCPSVSILATSRERLSLPGEAVWRVPPLTAEDAMELFVDRAALADVAVDLDRDRDTISAICARVDHLPLAIELAAAWTRLLPPARLLEGLEHRYGLLTGGQGRGPRRHRAMRASMEWSHELLTDLERTVFRRLGAFTGSVPLEDAAAVCGFGSVEADAILAVVARLVDKSLVMATGDDLGSIRLLDSVREYAAEELTLAGEWQEVHERHLNHYLSEALAVERGLGVDQERWRARAATINENVLSAIEWGLGEDRPRAAAELAVAMTMPWFLSGQTSIGLSLLDRALAVTDDAGLAAELHGAKSVLELVSGRKVPGAALAAAAPRAKATPAFSPRVRARALLVETFNSFFADFDRCERTAYEAARAGDAIGDAFIRDFGLLMGAYSLNARDRFPESLAMAQPALDAARERGDRFCVAFGLGLQQYAHLQTGRLAEAVRLGREMVQTIAPLSEYFGLGTLTSNLALAEVLRGETTEARRIMRPIVASVEAAPDVDVVGFQVPLGQASLLDGEWHDAMDWFSRGLTRLEQVEIDWTAARCLPGAVAALRELGRTAEAAAWLERGRGIARVQDAAQLHADLAEQEALLAQEDDPARAFDLHHQALGIRQHSGLTTYIPDSIDHLVATAASRDPSAQAVRILAAASRARTDMYRPRGVVARMRHERVLEVLRDALGHDEFEQAWSEGAALSLAQAVELLTRGRGARGRPHSGWSSLTPSELEVVRQVVAAKSNREIADALFISLSTVKTHLSHAFTKLGVGNRTELATFAAAQEDRRPD